MKNIILAVFAFISLSLSAQKVVTCSEYDEKKGTPSGIYESWDIGAKGGYVYIHYSQPKSIKKKLTLYIDKKDEKGRYNPYETLYFDTDEKTKENWATYKYTFTEDGTFKIIVLDNSNELASTTVTVNFKEGEKPTTTYEDDSDSDSEDEIDTYYYTESSVKVGQSIDEKFVLSGEDTYFTMPRSGSLPLTIVVEHTQPLSTDIIYIDIYDEDENLIKTLELDCDPTWDIISTKYTFEQKGTFYIDAYNAKDVYINTVTIHIE